MTYEEAKAKADRICDTIRPTEDSEAKLRRRIAEVVLCYERDLAALKNLNHFCLVRAEDAERDLAALRARIEAAREDDEEVETIRLLMVEGGGYDETGIKTGAINRDVDHLLSVLDAARADNAGLREALERVYARHCECRPLRFDRATYGHSHDCDTDITDDIERALASNPGERK